MDFSSELGKINQNSNNVWNIFVLGLIFVPKERNWGGVPLFVPLIQVAIFLRNKEGGKGSDICQVLEG